MNDDNKTNELEEPADNEKESGSAILSILESLPAEFGALMALKAQRLAFKHRNKLVRFQQQITIYYQISTLLFKHR